MLAYGRRRNPTDRFRRSLIPVLLCYILITHSEWNTESPLSMRAFLNFTVGIRNHYVLLLGFSVWNGADFLKRSLRSKKSHIIRNWLTGEEKRTFRTDSGLTNVSWRRLDVYESAKNPERTENFLSGQFAKIERNQNRLFTKTLFYGRAFKPTIRTYETPNEWTPGTVPENLRPIVKCWSSHYL